MELTTNVSAKDFLAYQRFVGQMIVGGIKPGASSFSMLNFSFLVVLGVYFAFLIIFYGKQGHYFDWQSGGVALFPAVFLVTFIVIFTARQQKIMMPLEGGVILGKHHYQFTEQGINEETVHYSSFTKWAAVKSVVTYQDQVFLFLDTTVAHIIPCSAFPSEEDVRTFVSFAQGHCSPKNA